MFKRSLGHTTSREYSILFLKIFHMCILRMANYKYQKNTLETAMESNPKSITRGLVCEFHAIVIKSMKSMKYASL